MTRHDAKRVYMRDRKLYFYIKSGPSGHHGMLTCVVHIGKNELTPKIKDAAVSHMIRTRRRFPLRKTTNFRPTVH